MLIDRVNEKALVASFFKSINGYTGNTKNGIIITHTTNKKRKTNKQTKASNQDEYNMPFQATNFRVQYHNTHSELMSTQKRRIFAVKTIVNNSSDGTSHTVYTDLGPAMLLEDHISSKTGDCAIGAVNLSYAMVTKNYNLLQNVDFRHVRTNLLRAVIAELAPCNTDNDIERWTPNQIHLAMAIAPDLRLDEQSAIEIMQQITDNLLERYLEAEVVKRFLHAVLNVNPADTPTLLIAQKTELVQGSPKEECLMFVSALGDILTHRDANFQNLETDPVIGMCANIEQTHFYGLIFNPSVLSNVRGLLQAQQAIRPELYVPIYPDGYQPHADVVVNS